MFNISIDNKYITYKSFVFSGGEVQVKLETSPIYHKDDVIIIHANVFSSNDVMELLMVTDALRRYFFGVRIKLKIPYLPYARQDRVCAVGEALSLKPMCKLINSQGYDSVEVWDVHSDVALGLLENVTNVHQSSFIYLVPKVNTVLVAPDAGAVKKTAESAKAYGLPMVTASKIRDVNTGEITGTEVYSGHIGDKNFLIVDDCLDGGRTYQELAKKLRPLTDGRIHLYVTHGIFSKGVDVVLENIDHVFVANLFPNVQKHDRLTVLDTRRGH
jgi:ribose-phosphate pyrophosphokinase